MAEVDTIDVKDAAAATQTVATISKLIKTAGLPSDAAVITDANGTLQQYLRGLVKQWIAGTLKLGAGTNEIGKANWRHFNVLGATLTRPANQTPYTGNDSVSNDGTAGNVTALTSNDLSDVNDDPINLTEILMDSTDTAVGVALATMRLHLFNSDPTASSGVVAGDNIAYSNKKAGWFGSFSGVMRPFSDGSKGVFVPDEGASRLALPASAAKNIWWQLQTIAAFTPSANSTTFTPRFKGFQGRL